MRRPHCGSGEDGSTRKNDAGGGQAGDGSTDPSHAALLTVFYDRTQ
jgi:hypothetical protein